MPTSKRAKKEHVSAVRPGAPSEAAEAYARLEPELDAVPHQLLRRISANIPMAVSLALGALPEIESLLPEMTDIFKQPPKAEIERLRERALALLYAHLLLVPSDPKALEALLDEARELRGKILSAADAHVEFGHLDPASVAAIREGSGHLDRANDLIALDALFEAAWDKIGDKTMVTPEQLDRAAALGTLLVAELGAKVLGNTAAKPAEKLKTRRQAAFTLLMDDYDEIRAAVAYVRRHEGDAAAFVPSLFTTRTPSKTKKAGNAENADPRAEGDTDTGGSGSGDRGADDAR